MIAVYVFLVVAGILNTIQAGSNVTLHKQLAHPFVPAVACAAVGLLTMLVSLLGYALWTKAPLPNAGAWARVPWWAYLGGVLGSVYVIAMVNVSGKVGASVFTGLTVTASVVTSLVMDHYALLGFDRAALSWPRALGATLLIGGLVLIGRY